VPSFCDAPFGVFEAGWARLFKPGQGHYICRLRHSHGISGAPLQISNFWLVGNHRFGSDDQSWLTEAGLLAAQSG